MKLSDPFFQIKLHPIDSRQITEFNQRLVKENKELIKKTISLQDRINQMRRDFNRELNNKHMAEFAQKRRLEKLQRQGFLTKDDEVFDFQNVKFFEVSDGIDPELAEQLNFKIQAIKDKFTEWQLKQMEYSLELKKKVYMYENLAEEFHGILSMSLSDIFKGVKLMDEEAEKVWNAMIQHLGHEYFLPIITKTYGHMFVSDPKKQ